jgi:hypothetical protein
MGDADKQAHLKSMVNILMREFASSYHYHYKIRFIDAQGNELIGVKRDGQADRVQILQPSVLQNRKDSDYYIRGMQLLKGEYYASDISPNLERGQVEKPLVPVVRFAAPVIGGNNVRYGVMVVSILGEAYFEYVRVANAVTPDRIFHLLNAKGEYLYRHGDKTIAGDGQAYGVNFNHDYADLFQRIKARDSQYTLASHGKIMSFRHILPNKNSHENGLVLVGMADQTVAYAELNDFGLRRGFTR